VAKFYIGLLIVLASINQAAAGFFDIPPPPIPEFDGASSIAVIALLAGVVSIVWHRSRSN
jgi:hypothetical protein